MFRAFNLTGCDWSKIDRSKGDAIFTENRERVRKSLEAFLDGKIVDGTKLTEHWFPRIDADVFISHSHKDEEAAIKCAGWLKSNFNLNPFVDSCVWGYADDLLKQIDNKYCLNSGGETYCYQKRNGSTSHVHMMLSSALSAMLDATECVIFIKSDNSITSSGAVDKTQSPWIFFELGTMRVIRRRKPSRKTENLVENFSRGMIKASQYYEAVYEVPLSELTPLTCTQLEDWRKTSSFATVNGKHVLDVLYEDIAPE